MKVSYQIIKPANIYSEYLYIPEELLQRFILCLSVFALHINNLGDCLGKTQLHVEADDIVNYYHKTAAL